MPPRMSKGTAARFVTNRLVNPLVRPLMKRGLWPRTHALLETTGRKTAFPAGSRSETASAASSFWIVTEHGYAAADGKHPGRSARAG